MTTMTASSAAPGVDFKELLSRARTQAGESLLEMSNRSPVMIVFLRHTGCPFCREAMRDVKKQRAAIEADGTRVVFVHQGPEDQYTQKVFSDEGVADLPRVSDPERTLYRAMGLKRGNLWQMFGVKVWWRSMQAVASGARGGKVVGDAFQMPGVFVVFKGRVVRSMTFKSQSDRPDYSGIACESSACVKEWGKE